MTTTPTPGIDLDKLAAIADRVDARGLFNASCDIREWIALARRSSPSESAPASTSPSSKDAAAKSEQALTGAPRFNSLGIAENWSVTVEAEGERVLCISNQHYAGLGESELDAFEATIRNCGEHLLAFVGPTSSASAAGAGSEQASAQPVAAADDLRTDYLADQHYLLGLRAGWNQGVVADYAQFDAAIAARGEQLRAARHELREVAQPVAAAPAGWRLVPTKLTPEMRAAARDKLGFTMMYEAAIAAAPAAPVAQAAPVSTTEAERAQSEKADAANAARLSCPECSGTGSVLMDSDCSDCNGKGFNWEPTEPDHGETVLRIQGLLGITQTGWVSPDVIALRIQQLQDRAPATSAGGLPPYEVVAALNSLRWMLNKSDECDKPNMRVTTLLDKHHSKDGRTIRQDLEILWRYFNPNRPEMTALLLSGGDRASAKGADGQGGAA